MNKKKKKIYIYIYSHIYCSLLAICKGQPTAFYNFGSEAYSTLVHSEGEL